VWDILFVIDEIQIEIKDFIVTLYPIFLFCCCVRQSHSVAQGGLKLLILLPLPPQGWDYSCALPHLPIILFYFLPSLDHYMKVSHLFIYLHIYLLYVGFTL
jgi:hypothetical protein